MFHPKKTFGCQKIKCRESSETRFGKISRRSQPSSRDKRPFKVLLKLDSENFKRPKNREDSSDLDEILTKSITAMKTIISKNCFGQISRKNCAKTSRKRRRGGRWMRRRRRGGAENLFSTPLILFVQRPVWIPRDHSQCKKRRIKN